MKPNSKPKKSKGTDKSEMHFEESESCFPTGTEENELYDDDVSYGVDYFTNTDVYLI
jgi:hypothetical protein